MRCAASQGNVLDDPQTFIMGGTRDLLEFDTLPFITIVKLDSCSVIVLLSCTSFLLNTLSLGRLNEVV